MKYLILITSLFMLLGSAGSALQRQNAAQGPFKVAGHDLLLQERDGKCLCVYTKYKIRGEVQMTIPSPCQWVRDHKGLPQSKTYNDLGKATVLLVVGGPIDASHKDALMKDGCGSQVQAITIGRRGVVASTKVTQVGSLCPTAGADEKFFWMLSHER